MKSPSSPHVGTHVRTTRAAWLGLAAGGVGVLSIARFLHPDLRGFGTHVQLGLPPCGFLSLTHWPCPACGLTTAFAFMARAELTHALHANAFGVLLFAIVAVSIPLCAWAALRDLPMREAYVKLRGERALVVLALSWMSSWIAHVLSL